MEPLPLAYHALDVAVEIVILTVAIEADEIPLVWEDIENNVLTKFDGSIKELAKLSSIRTLSRLAELGVLEVDMLDPVETCHWRLKDAKRATAILKRVTAENLARLAQLNAILGE